MQRQVDGVASVIRGNLAEARDIASDLTDFIGVACVLSRDLDTTYL
jgi:hypothetical protein